MLKFLKNTSFLFFIVLLFSCSSTKEISIKEITGKIYALGNEPFLNYGIEDYNGTGYKIMKSSPIFNKLNILQGEYCKVVIDISKSKSWDELYITKISLIKKE